MTMSSVFIFNEQFPVSTNYGKSKIRQIKPRQSPARNFEKFGVGCVLLDVGRLGVLGDEEGSLLSEFGL